jgi:CheY-like chemotaxis protein/two-component sensor histidine kinase
MNRAKTVIERQAAHLSRLVDDLLDVSRIARGKVQIRKEHVDLAEVVRRTVEDHRGLFASKGISLAFKGDGPLWLDADATRLAQVTENLLHNAAKFTDQGGHVVVALEQESGQGMLRIRDDGAGIEREALATIFKPYVQGERTLNPALGGLGLGLALSRGLVDLHGGSMRAFSEGPGKGAEFVVALPLLRGPRPPPRRIPTPRPSRHLRICIIDDNEDAAHTLQDVLELDGHDVHIAMDGQRGLDLALAVQPDVVLCDVGLPVLDGLEVARRLRAAGSTAMLVALTGYASTEDVQFARDAGFDHHLAKPTDLARLDAVLAEATIVAAG